MKVALIATLAVLVASCTDSHRSPYVGETSREIKSLSQEEITGYLSGGGLGFARIAELNGYPGPKHVLEMASELQLTEDQRGKTQAVFDRMNSTATELGRQLIEVERSLDERFVSGHPDATAVAASIAQSADLQGGIRLAHVTAHLEMMDILTDHQVALYAKQRGYDAGDGGHADHKGHRM